MYTQNYGKINSRLNAHVDERYAIKKRINLITTFVPYEIRCDARMCVGVCVPFPKRGKKKTLSIVPREGLKKKKKKPARFVHVCRTPRHRA